MSNKLNSLLAKLNQAQDAEDQAQLDFSAADRALHDIAVKVELGEAKKADMVKGEAAYETVLRQKSAIEAKVRTLNAAIKIQRRRDSAQKTEDDELRRSLLLDAAQRDLEPLRQKCSVLLGQLAGIHESLSDTTGCDLQRLAGQIIDGSNNQASMMAVFDKARLQWMDDATKKPTIVKVA